MSIESTELWKVIFEESTDRSLEIQIAEAGKDLGLPIIIHEQKKEKPNSFDIWTSPQLFTPLNTLLEEDPEIGALDQALHGASLGKPRVENLPWDRKTKLQVTAQWWDSRGNQEKARRILQDQQPLSPEDIKKILTPKLRQIKENL